MLFLSEIKYLAQMIDAKGRLIKVPALTNVSTLQVLQGLALNTAVILSQLYNY